MRLPIFFVVAVLVGLLGLAPAALAVGGTAAPSASLRNSTPEERQMMRAEALIRVQDFETAIVVLEDILRREPRSADALNWLGFSHRKLGRFDEALAHYEKALAIDPRHRGANEYLGELYLQMGQPEKAELRLAVLAEACGPGCEEYAELKDAIAAYRGSPES